MRVLYRVMIDCEIKKILPVTAGLWIVSKKLMRSEQLFGGWISDQQTLGFSLSQYMSTCDCFLFEEGDGAGCR